MSRFALTAIAVVAVCVGCASGVEPTVTIDAYPKGVLVTNAEGARCITPCRVAAAFVESDMTFTAAGFRTLVIEGGRRFSAMDVASGAAVDFLESSIRVTLMHPDDDDSIR